MRKGRSIFNNYGLAGEVAKFADFLRENGFRVFQSSIQDALVSLKSINLFNKADFFAALRANLVKTDMEWTLFPRLFDEFWGFYINKKNKNIKKKILPFIEDVSNNGEEGTNKQNARTLYKSLFKEEKQYFEGVGYSPISRVKKKEISLFSDSDVQVARLALKKMAEPFKTYRSRRMRKGHYSGNNLDFVRIMRKSLKYDGVPFELFFKEKKKKLRRLLIIADVSGSMERYASFVIPFILSIRGAGSKAEVFVFSTSLTRVTHIVKHLNIEKALQKISEDVPNWAGGTRIGYSLKQFNKLKSGLIDKRSVVVILSDGWDLGSKELLRREIEVLSKRVHSIIWLNPILNDPNLNKMCKGMIVALPYVDHLLPVNNLEDLKRVGRLISRLILH